MELVMDTGRIEKPVLAGELVAEPFEGRELTTVCPHCGRTLLTVAGLWVQCDEEDPRYGLVRGLGRTCSCELALRAAEDEQRAQRAAEELERQTQERMRLEHLWVKSGMPRAWRERGLRCWVRETAAQQGAYDVVTTRHALDHEMFTKHGMTRKALRHLPSAIANPICIAESQSVPGALEILTTLTETVEDSKTKALVKKNVLVALHVGVTSSTDRRLIVSKIASAYGKNHIRTIINKHKILYWNDQKGKVMLNDYRLQLPQAVAHDLSTGNIWDFNDLVKYKQQNKFSFSME